MDTHWIFRLSSTSFRTPSGLELAQRFSSLLRAYDFEMCPFGCLKRRLHDPWPKRLVVSLVNSAWLATGLLLTTGPGWAGPLLFPFSFFSSLRLGTTWMRRVPDHSLF